MLRNLLGISQLLFRLWLDIGRLDHCWPSSVKPWHGGTTEEGNSSYLLPLSHRAWGAIGPHNEFRYIILSAVILRYTAAYCGIWLYWCNIITLNYDSTLIDGWPKIWGSVVKKSLIIKRNYWMLFLERVCIYSICANFTVVDFTVHCFNASFSIYECYVYVRHVETMHCAAIVTLWKGL